MTLDIFQAILTPISLNFENYLTHTQSSASWLGFFVPDVLNNGSIIVPLPALTKQPGFNGRALRVFGYR